MRDYFAKQMPYRTLTDLAPHKQRVLVRADLNVPMLSGRIMDEVRIHAALPTLRQLLESGNKVVLMSHLGRPVQGHFQPAQHSLQAVADALSRLLPYPVHFCPTCVGKTATQAVAALSHGEVLLLENLRAHPAETNNESAFARTLATYGDIYINDAFGTLHRAHASTAGVAKHFKQKGIGLLIQRECEQLHYVMHKPNKPLCCLLGGSKVSDKIDLIEALLPLADDLLIGGAMAFSFLYAKGIAVGRSKIEADKMQAVQKINAQAKAKGVSIHLPVDVWVARKPEDTNKKCVAISDIPDDARGFDIGTKSCQLFARLIHQSKRIIWNGPMGVYEQKAFATGTYAVIGAIAEATQRGAFSLAGGGDSLAALKSAGYDASILSHVSTGGGAMLAYLQKKPLPALEALHI